MGIKNLRLEVQNISHLLEMGLGGTPVTHPFTLSPYFFPETHLCESPYTCCGPLVLGSAIVSFLLFIIPFQVIMKSCLSQSQPLFCISLLMTSSQSSVCNVTSVCFPSCAFSLPKMVPLIFILASS